TQSAPGLVPPELGAEARKIPGKQNSFLRLAWCFQAGRRSQNVPKMLKNAILKGTKLDNTKGPD
ncbi:hypothetical protein A2U01_0114778, partial [Trifolium medium]|nr:hypothetical protein [Trifolium medium]